jgi:hypothetical protein
MRTRKRKDDDRRKVGPEPSVCANFDVGTLCNRNMNSMRSPLGVHTRSDRQTGAGCEREMGRRKIRAGLRIQREPGILAAEATQAAAVHGLDRLQAPTRRDARHWRLIDLRSELAGGQAGAVCREKRIRRESGARGKDRARTY